MPRIPNVAFLGLLAAAWALAACSTSSPRADTGASPARADSTMAPAPGESTGAPARSGPTPAPAPGAHAASDSAPAAPPAPTSSTGTAAATTGTPGDSGYVQYDAATKTVTFRIVAGPFDFNGFTKGNGAATLTIPPGSKNVWNFEQNDGTPHSIEVASGSGPVPNSGGNPAIPRAYSNKVIEGLPQGAKDVIQFTAPDTGTYRIICGVPGHALSGMWLWLKIDPSAKTPTFGPTKS